MLVDLRDSYSSYCPLAPGLNVTILFDTKTQPKSRKASDTLVQLFAGIDESVYLQYALIPFALYAWLVNTVSSFDNSIPRRLGCVLKGVSTL